MTQLRHASLSLATERSVPALRDVSLPRGSRHEECERRCAKGLYDTVQTLADKVAQSSARSSTSWRRSRLVTSSSRAFSGRCRCSTRSHRTGMLVLVYVRER